MRWTSHLQPPPGRTSCAERQEAFCRRLLVIFIRSPSSCLSAPRTATAASRYAGCGEGKDSRGGAKPPTHGMLARVPKHGIPGQDMARGEGAESARVFGIWTDLEVICLGCFCQFLDTVLRKCPERGSQKVTNRTDCCDDCDGCDFQWRVSPLDLP